MRFGGSALLSGIMVGRGDPSCYQANTELLRLIVDAEQVPSVDDNQPHHINAALHELIAATKSYPEFGQSGVVLTPHG